MIDKNELKRAINFDRYYHDQLGESQGRVADGWKFFCPFHSDRKTPNLFVGNDGRVKCFACDEGGDIFWFHQKNNGISTFPETVNDLARKYASHLLNGSGNGQPNRKIIEEYDYKDEAGNLLFQVIRYEPKDFRQRVPDGKGGDGD